MLRDRVVRRGPTVAAESRRTTKASKKIPGLTKRGGVWHIDKQVQGYGRLCLSTHETDEAAAIEVLLEELQRIKQAQRFGVRAPRTFEAAAARFIDERTARQAAGELKSAGRDCQDLDLVVPFIGHLELSQICDEALAAFKKARLAGLNADGSKRQRKPATARTVNRTIAVINLVLQRATVWRDESGLTWLESAPRLEKMPETKSHKPYPLEFDEEELVFALLPEHLVAPCVFAVNTGCRESEVCNLRWEWLRDIPELKRTAFEIPGEYTKNGQPKLVPLNKLAAAAVKKQLGKHKEFVFAHAGETMKKLFNSAWQRARVKAAARYEEKLGRACPPLFIKIRGHDLRHSFGSRLRAAGVSFETRQDLLGHANGNVTIHYSLVRVAELFRAVDAIADRQARRDPAAPLVRPPKDNLGRFL